MCWIKCNGTQRNPKHEEGRNEVHKVIQNVYWWKELTKEDKEDAIKNKDKFITDIAKKMSLRKPSASTIPNEVTVSEKNNEHLSSLAMLWKNHLIHVQSKTKLQKKSKEQRKMMKVLESENNYLNAELKQN